MKLLLTASALLCCANAVSAPRAFDAHDLVMLDRVSDPQLSPDGKRVAYQVRETDYAANKGKNGLWVLDLGDRDGKRLRLTESSVSATSPRWSADGTTVFFQAKIGDTMQIWSRKADGKGAAQQVTGLALDVNAYKLSADGKQVLLSVDTFAECANQADAFACTKKRLDDKTANKASGVLYDKLFIRHWDTWADGRRSQLYIASIDANGKISGAPKLLTAGIDGDVPSKPFGDDSEFAFSPDGRTVYFDVRIAGRSEPWSTNFDIYSVPADGSSAAKNLTAANQAWDAYPLPSADGKTLYYLAMKRPTFEADRFGIMALDLASGTTREIDAQWDRSPGGLQLSKDGKILYATADDNGDHPLFAIDIKTGKATKLSGAGQVEAFSAVGSEIVVAHSTLKAPADLFRLNGGGGAMTPVTHLNTARLTNVAMGDYEFYTFKGADGATVQGYVVKPAGFEKGKKYPVAFIIHGGPQGAMTNEFHYRWNPQTYAGQGFAVVTVNFHGSTGYGQAFTDAISGDWGGKPLEDLQKGWAAALEKYSFLDAGRACALGASYGGYMIYWIAGNWPQPWKCLVDHDGVFDARMMAYSTEELWFDEWEHHGTQWEKPDVYEKFNPVNHVAQWKVPMLIVHGAKDFRIPVEQGIAAFTALQRRGIPSEFLTFPDENHWVLKPQNSVLWHETVNAWLKKWTTAVPAG
jgi:dipeptidyl aminopeptidase/acylaminoacyl peptidase